MNKRQAKKRYKKALHDMKTGRKRGISVSIINHGYVDKNGKDCSHATEGARLIYFKRPRITYYRSVKEGQS